MVNLTTSLKLKQLHLNYKPNFESPLTFSAVVTLCAFSNFVISLDLHPLNSFRILPYRFFHLLIKVWRLMRVRNLELRINTLI